MFGLLPKKLNQFPAGGSGAFVLLKSAPGNSNVHSDLRTIEMWILKFTLLKQGGVYALFLLLKRRNQADIYFFSNLAPGCSLNRTMDSNDSFLNSVGKTKDELLSWSSWQLLLFNANYSRHPSLPETPPQWHTIVRLSHSKIFSGSQFFNGKAQTLYPGIWPFQIWLKTFIQDVV